MGIKQEWAELKQVGIKQYCRNKKGNHHDDTNAWWDVIAYDPTTNRYRLDRTTIKERDVSPDALKVTGEKNHYVTIASEQPKREIRDSDGYLNTCAISNYLYLKNNAINDAMASVWKPGPINLKLLAILGIGAAIIVYLFFMKM